MRPEIVSETDYQIEFGNGSILSYFFEVSCGARFDNIFIDEAAFLKDANKKWFGIYPTVVNGRVCILSTPNGAGEWFYKMFISALNNLNGFKAYDCDISEHPVYSELVWRKSILKYIGEKGFRQEYMSKWY